MARRSSSAAATAPPAQEVLTLPDGATAALAGDALELRDAGGRLLVRYQDGAAEICAPAGDLTLSAPLGRVVLKAATDVEIEAERDITQRAARRASLKTGALAVEARESRLVTGQATILARHIATTAMTLAQSVERYELTATRIVETARDAFHDVKDLCQTRIGRARTLVKGAYSVHARRAIVASKEETKVDGKKVLLG
jgi:hypothetical protein